MIFRFVLAKIYKYRESLVLRRKARDFFHNGDRQMQKTGFYIIKNNFLTLTGYALALKILTGTNMREFFENEKNKVIENQRKLPVHLSAEEFKL